MRVREWMWVRAESRCCFFLFFFFSAKFDVTQKTYICNAMGFFYFLNDEWMNAYALFYFVAETVKKKYFWNFWRRVLKKWEII